MAEFIEFGWDAFGFIVASVVLLFIASAFCGFVFHVIEALADWCERNGWN